MIVTEYMENGSLDAFLRVRAPLCFPHGPGEGSSVWVMGDHARPPNTPWSPELRPNRPGEGGARGGEGQSVQVPFSPHHVKVPLLWVLRPCPAHRLRAVPLWVPRAPPSWEAWGGGRKPRFPALAWPCVCRVVRDRAIPLWVSLSPWANWMTSLHAPPTYLPLRVAVRVNET